MVSDRRGWSGISEICDISLSLSSIMLSHLSEMPIVRVCIANTILRAIALVWC